MTPIISIITGTFNRRVSLARFVGSVRRNVPLGIPYEVILVDGGSTDGTQAWCASQPDVVLIEQGELKGAISAFTEGANAAQGEYVLLGNDDVELAEGSLMRALTYLDTHPGSGAVAFADNRPAPGYEDAGYKVQTMSVQTHSTISQQNYAQVGLFRKWLGDLCGWWGADDPDFPGHTYGGDNYLSARIYEYGYGIAASPDEWRVTDHLESDSLRERNYKIEQQNPAAYYKRFPEPPIYGRLEKPDNPQLEHLRVLYLPLYEPGYGQYKTGLRLALQRVGYVWEVDYQNNPYDLPAIVAQFQPHILLMQCHSPYDVTLAQLTAARAQQPGMLVINWNGDVYEQNLTSDKMLAFLKHVDLQLTVNADTLPVYRDHGIRAAYWQVGFEPVDYAHLPLVQAHDVVFLANCYSDSRKALGGALRSLKVNVGLYGRAWQWGNGDTTYQFAPSAALCRNAKICIGDNQYGNRGFVSNRVFETLAAGGFLMHQTVPGLEDLTGLKDGVHYVAWNDLNDLQTKVKHWLRKSSDTQRQQIAEAGRAFVQEHHSFEARVKELLTEIIPLLERVGV